MRTKDAWIDELVGDFDQRWNDERALVTRRTRGAPRRVREEVGQALEAARRIAERRLRRWAGEHDVGEPAAEILDDVVEDALTRVTGDDKGEEE
jgi:hypothetical protein